MLPISLCASGRMYTNNDEQISFRHEGLKSNFTVQGVDRSFMQCQSCYNLPGHVVPDPSHLSRSPQEVSMPSTRDLRSIAIRVSGIRYAQSMPQGLHTEEWMHCFSSPHDVDRIRASVA